MNSKMKISGFTNQLAIIFACLIFAISIYLYAPVIQNYSLTPKWISLLILGVVLTFFSASKLSNRPSFIMSIWMMFVLVCCLQCFRSYNFWDSLLHLTPLILGPLLIGLLASMIKNRHDFLAKLALLLAILLLPILLYTIYELAILIWTGKYGHDATYSFRFSFGHRNQFSQFIVLSIPILMIGLKGKLNKKLVLILTIILIYTIAILLKNRTVLIILFGVYPMLYFFYLIRARSKKIKRFFLVSVLGVGLASGVGLAVIDLDPESTIGNLVETNFGSGNERLRIWKNSIDLAKEHPIIGYGTGDWKAEIL
ncbi:MAG: O-antigen ligase, partial [Arenicella sp.]